VINKMLRDLDNRHAAGTVANKAQESRTGIVRDTLVVNDAQRQVSRGQGMWRLRLAMAALIAFCGGAIGVWWYLNQGLAPQPLLPARPTAAVARAPAPAAALAPPSVPSVVSVPLVAVPAASVTAAVSEPAPAPMAATGLTLKNDSSLSRVPPLDKPAKPVAVSKPTTPLVQTPAQAPAPGLASDKRLPATPANAPVPAASAPQNTARQPATQEVLAQAQSLWNVGSRDQAIDLLRDALASAQRANLAGKTADSTLVLAPLARELARMEMAEGRVTQALDMLTQLEPALSGVADIWAIRGNAAQRLGRHSESAEAYRMALKLRPGEPRWMLGAAVSLAIQGQTAAATELAEQARSGGALSPEVTDYLRQLGVILPQR
jgi:hypothetical protein